LLSLVHTDKLLGGLGKRRWRSARRRLRFGSWKNSRVTREGYGELIETGRLV
jgi:hypothetical protein